VIRGAVPVLAGVALAVLLQLSAGPLIGPFAVKLLMDIGINVILAVSLNLVNGFTGQFSIGHAGFMAVGGYVAGCITYYGSILLWGGTGVQAGWLSGGDLLFVAGCVAGALIAAAAGYVVGLPSLRLRGDYLAIVTLGFGEILRVMLQRTGDVLSTPEEVRGASVGTLATSLGGSLGFSGIPYYTDLFWVYAFVALTLTVALRLKFSSYGRAFLSIRENEIAAEAVGINTTRLKVRAFVLAAAFAGIAGGLFAHEVGTSLNPRELGFQKSFDIVIMVVLGGMGSVSGAVLAAIVLTLLPEALRGFSEFRMPIYALALILMMILRPQGILGLKELWELSWFPGRRARARTKTP
jgi:branched-chain amino acid transport system permease protein